MHIKKKTSSGISGTHALYIKIICSHQKSRETIPLSNQIVKINDYLPINLRSIIIILNNQIDDISEFFYEC